MLHSLNSVFGTEFKSEHGIETRFSWRAPVGHRLYVSGREESAGKDKMRDTSRMRERLEDQLMAML